MRSTVLGILAVAVLGVVGSSAMASSISLDTYQGSGWQVTRVLRGDESDKTAYSGAVQNVASNPGWISGVGGAAQWVAWTSQAGSGYTGDADGPGNYNSPGTSYIYSLEFTIADFTGPGGFFLNATMAMDNWVSSVTLTQLGNPDSSIAVTVSPNSSLSPTEYGYRYAISANVADVEHPLLVTFPATFVLTVTGVNSYNSTNNDPNWLASTNPGPTGFILTGIADPDTLAVPVPMAAWTGLSTLLGIGALGVMRRRARHSVAMGNQSHFRARR